MKKLKGKDYGFKVFIEHFENGGMVDFCRKKYYIYIFCYCYDYLKTADQNIMKIESKLK